MPRLMTFGTYAAVGVIAVIAGLFIATMLRTATLPAAGFATPTGVAPRQVTTPTSGVPSRTATPTATASHQTATPTLQPTASLTPLAAATAPATEIPPSPIALSGSFPTITPTSTTPPASRLIFRVRIFDKPTDAAVPCGASFESRIWGVVKDANGRGIYRAVVQISSADGKNRFSRATNNQGGFEVPGLGCTTWVVRLISVPRAPNGLQAQALSVRVNGGRYSGAGIEFRQQ